MVGIALLVVAAVLGGWFIWWRWGSRILRASQRLDAAWQEVEQALIERSQAIETFLNALSTYGFVPEARKKLTEVLPSIRKAVGPQALAEADEQLKVALRAAFSGLPRDRPADVRDAQNRLAEAEDELDIVRRRYNELVLDWNNLLRGFPYRFIARRKGFFPRELYLGSSEAEEFARRHLPPI